MSESLPHEARRSQASSLILQAFVVNGRDTLCLDSQVMSDFDMTSAEADDAIEELVSQGQIVLQAEEAVRLTTQRCRTVDEIWRRGRLPDALSERLVMGFFEGESEYPVRLAVPVKELAARIPKDSPIGRDLADGRPHAAWELRYPPTGKRGDRFLVRMASGSIPAVADTPLPGTVPHPGRWLPVDESGHCSECGRDLAELLFLMAMGAG